MTDNPRVMCLFCGRVLPIERAPEHTCRPKNSLGPYLAPTWRQPVEVLGSVQERANV